MKKKKKYMYLLLLLLFVTGLIILWILQKKKGTTGTVEVGEGDFGTPGTDGSLSDKQCTCNQQSDYTGTLEEIRDALINKGTGECGCY